MSKIYIYTSFDKNANWACATADVFIAPGVKPYATIDTDHADKISAWYAGVMDITKSADDKIVNGVTFKLMGPDELINLIRGAIWLNFHEQGAVTLDANREAYRAPYAIA